MILEEILPVITGLLILTLLVVWAVKQQAVSGMASKQWRIWINGTPSDAMTAHQVWEMFTSKTIADDTFVQVDGDSRGWVPLTHYLEDLNSIARQQPPAMVAQSGNSLKMKDVAVDGIGTAFVLGALLLVVGLALGFSGLTMDVTVTAESGRSINNIGLMNDRLVRVIAAGFASLMGVLMMLLGGKKK